MKYNCEMIEDLLALYQEDACSEASRKAVEEHLAECPRCRKLVEEIRSEPEPVAVTGGCEQAVLKNTAHRLTRRAIGSAVGVTAIVLYWIVCFWMEFFASAGNYRYFSWSFYEMYSAGRWIVPLLTGLWLAALLIGTVRRRTYKRNAVLILVLCMLTLGQIGWVQKQARMEHVSCWTTVEEIPDEYHIIIKNGTEREVLETTPTVTGLLKQDGTVYYFSYQRDPKAPQNSRLEFAKQAE